eukprot:GFUD01030251.1.p1 GENE.GFUD01030251.1~~GFUD01030251.1.p1  ORF type:complete len:504 (-),score=102.74 GFUD01030251.1:97-1608(-)
MTWDLLPEPLLFSILSTLSYHEIIRVGFTCRRWHTVSMDNLLWKKVICRDFKLSLKTTIHPLGKSWKEEYTRLVDDTPNVISEELNGHQDEVLHVSFSNSGKHFVTCSKDGYLMVWNINQMGITSLRYNEDMKKYGWQFTWASKYNSNDSLLLVAGVIDDIMGEIAIFECSDVGDYVILCKIKNNPYDVMGAWCDDVTWLSGRLTEDQIQFNLDATVHMCRTYPGETHSLTHPHSAEVYKNIALKFRNHINDGSNYLRCLIVSNRKNIKDDKVFPTYEDFATNSHPLTIEEQEADETCKTLLQDNKFCLIFLCSGNTSVPHQIGFKRLYSNDLSSVPVIDKPDKLIEMQGHIVGISQDSEGRFLYVNVRRWPEGAVPTENNPPPIASEIEMRVVDLQDLSLTSQVYKGHKGYTDSQGAFYIYLDVKNAFVGSGSEDGSAYVWDKHYGCQVAANKHDECVNCVAFSPTDGSVMVSVSDDHKVKVWMSKSRERIRQNGAKSLINL